MRHGTRAIILILAALTAALPSLTGCGVPAAPQPPSLYFPEPVTDLTAVRSGNEVHLHWTMPKRTTDKIELKGDQQAHICRRVAGGPCETAGDVAFAPQAQADFTDHLPADLTSGNQWLITYTVELRNHRGHTAGPSNPAYVFSGVAPTPVAGFAAQVRADGVLLQWQPAQDASSLIRIQRTLVPKTPVSKTATPSTPSKSDSDSELMGAQAPPVQTLEVAYVHDPTHAFDKDAAFDQTYRYVAQRIAVATLSGHTVEIASAPSQIVGIETRDIFPPAIPRGLLAVASPDEHAIDLSWTPNTENDLAGYIVFRREAASTAPATRISPEEPVGGPAFRDSTAKPGVRYAYSVIAVDQDHNESGRSQETEETLPQ
jgi:hypothetical protein